MNRPGLYIPSSRTKHGAPIPTPKNNRVALLVNNACLFDSRAIKEAETLVADGWRVRVVCRQDGAEPAFETRNGVEYQRHPRRRPLAFLSGVFGRGPAETSPDAPGQPRADTPPPSPPSPWRWAYPLLRLLKRTLGRHLSEIYIHWECADAFKAPLNDFAPAVVHACDLVTLPAAVAAAKRPGCKVVYDIRDLAVVEYPDHPAGIKLWRRVQERRLIRRADMVIVPSDGFADFLQARYGITRPDIVCNSPDTETLGTDKGLRESLDFFPETPLIAFTGMLRYDRGLREIFQALALCPGFHFARVGPDDDALNRAAKEMAAELDILDRVHLVPPVPTHQVPGFIASADLAVIANHNFSANIDLAMPNKIFEYALAGLPVAVGRYREVGQFVDDNNIGIVMDETNPEDIARAFREIYENRDRLAPDAEKRGQLAETYGWPAQGRVLAALYRGFFSGGAK